MQHIRLFLVFFLLVFPFLLSYGQTQFAGWVAAMNSFKVSEKFSLGLDVQFRSNDQVKSLQTFIFRPAINWNFKKNMSATAGYGYFRNQRTVSGVTGYAPEHRIWEQFMVTHNIGFVPLSHRFRLEQRFISKSFVRNNTLENEGNQFANRLRYFNRAMISLKKQKPFVKGPFAAVQNEVFLNLGDKSAVNGKFFDQNRLYLAAGYRFSQKFDGEIGYLNQYVSGKNKTFTNNHILQIVGYIRL